MSIEIVEQIFLEYNFISLQIVKHNYILNKSHNKDFNRI